MFASRFFPTYGFPFLKEGNKSVALQKNFFFSLTFSGLRRQQNQLFTEAAPRVGNVCQQNTFCAWAPG